MRLRLVLAALLSAPLPASAGGFAALDLPGSQLTALTDDGRAAAGSLAGVDGGGFLWRRGHGARLLPDAVSVRALSPSGRYVAGSALDADANEVATWWDADGGAHRIDALPGRIGAPSRSETIGDGGELSGFVHDRDGHGVAFSWTAAGGLRVPAPAVPRTPPACGDAGAGPAGPADPPEFVAASRDGALRVGYAGRGGQRRAIVWTVRGGTQPLDAFLAAHGVEVPRGWILVAATTVDADARRIGGYGLHPHRFDSFIAELPANVRILCDSSPSPTASRHRKSAAQSIPSQEIKP